jgi:hypothetical protein
VRAAHRVFGFREFAEEPLHFCGVERRIHFDGGVARGGGGDFRLERIDRDGLIFARDAVENFKEQAFCIALVTPAGAA